jgi:CBS domain-containing protein
MKILELMKTHVIKTAPEATMRDVVDMLDLYQLTTLPVVDGEERLLGVITEHDIATRLIPAFVEAAASDKMASAVDQIGAQTVAEMMTTPAISVDENDDVAKAVSLMTASGVKRIPVTSDGKLIGTISRVDICQAILEGQLTG